MSIIFRSESKGPYEDFSHEISSQAQYDRISLILGYAKMQNLLLRKFSNQLSEQHWQDFINSLTGLKDSLQIEVDKIKIEGCIEIFLNCINQSNDYAQGIDWFEQYINKYDHGDKIIAMIKGLIKLNKSGKQAFQEFHSSGNINWNRFSDQAMQVISECLEMELIYFVGAEECRPILKVPEFQENVYFYPAYFLIKQQSEICLLEKWQVQLLRMRQNPNSSQHPRAIFPFLTTQQVLYQNLETFKKSQAQNSLSIVDQIRNNQDPKPRNSNSFQILQQSSFEIVQQTNPQGFDEPPTTLVVIPFICYICEREAGQPFKIHSDKLQQDLCAWCDYENMFQNELNQNPQIDMIALQY